MASQMETVWISECGRDCAHTLDCPLPRCLFLSLCLFPSASLSLSLSFFLSLSLSPALSLSSLTLPSCTRTLTPRSPAQSHTLDSWILSCIAKLIECALVLLKCRCSRFHACLQHEIGPEALRGKCLPPAVVETRQLLVHCNRKAVEGRASSIGR